MKTKLEGTKGSYCDEVDEVWRYAAGPGLLGDSGGGGHLDGEA